MAPSVTDSPTITVVTCLRDEGPYLVDWVAHLLTLGVGRILAYTNDCSDGTEALLDALAPAGVIHVAQGACRDSPGPTPQWRALRAAWDHPAVAGAEWLLHLDVDEWIALTGPTTLADLIAACGRAQAIALPWRLFGCDGRFAPGEGPVPARFTRAAPEAMAYPALGAFFKTLFRRDGPWSGFGIHRPLQTAPPRFADETGHLDDALARSPKRILLWRGGKPAPGRLVQLNHYSIRSIHEFLVKRRRGLPNHTDKEIDLTYWVERNFNATRCRAIEPHLPAMAARAAELRALDGVAEREAACRAAQARALDEVLATPEGAALCGRLVLAAGSVAPEPRLGRHLVALQRAAVAGRQP
ncbi:glycosyltransferase family 2 protein [Jannaschia seohaensis]|uniref:Glycosyl transferase family 2 n=1 Tax=Jannaschia seohaensis TaxID=475081 RepID=A0A2Y9C7K8_9RHOB|nr:glycosyltransferase family 2 protein [Jannaschia seohaensis]PWJ19281.1 glycosyl transferase family 2 [Jannaschia seohaensis]SSA45943.1 Glycosyl transferase family 2 [Jannaschia seohaensis]